MVSTLNFIGIQNGATPDCDPDQAHYNEKPFHSRCPYGLIRCRGTHWLRKKSYIFSPPEVIVKILLGTICCYCYYYCPICTLAEAPFWQEAILVHSAGSGAVVTGCDAPDFWQTIKGNPVGFGNNIF